MLGNHPFMPFIALLKTKKICKMNCLMKKGNNDQLQYSMSDITCNYCFFSIVILSKENNALKGKTEYFILTLLY